MTRPKPSKPEPAFLRISRDLIHQIRTGQRVAGDKLPGSRSLAAEEDVHRNTVLAAYGELEAQGWIESWQGQGTYVSETLPKGIAHTAGDKPTHNYRLGASIRTKAPPPPSSVLVMGGGVPDTRLIPATELSRSLRRALQRAPRLLDYGDPRGTLRLRKAVSQMLREKRGVVSSEENVLITRGSQMGIYLLGQGLLRAGDRVAIESTGYPPAWQALERTGASLVAIPVDDQGMKIEFLKERHAQEPVRAVYLTPHHQFPTLVTLSASRRAALQSFARRHRIAILEDDYDHEFHYEGRPVPPMASSDSSGNVIYIGTLSKVLAPGLRTGYLIAPTEVIAKLASLRSLIDNCGDAVSENAVAEWIEEGELDRHARRVRKLYMQRRTALLKALQLHLPDALAYQVPTGGMALWVKCIGGVSAKRWAERALAAGLQVSSASDYRHDKRDRPFLRLGFARLNEEEIARAVSILAETRPLMR